MNAAEIVADQETKAQRALKFITSFIVDSDESYGLAEGELVSVKDRMKALEAERVKITVPLNEALNAANGLFRGPRSLLEQAESLLKTKMIAWRAAQERRIAAAREEAERQAKAERDRLAAEAQRLQAAGNVAEAQAQMALAEVTVAAVVVPPMPSGGRSSVAKVLGFEIADKMEFLRFVLANTEKRPELAEFIVIDSIRLRKQVRALGHNLNFPGIIVGSKDTMRVR